MGGARDRSRSPMGGGFGGVPMGGGIGNGISEIMNLIVTREQARLNKEWGYADQVRQQLNAMGVQLFDKTQSWTHSDGRKGRIPSFNEIEAGVTADTLVAQANMAPPAGANDPA